MQRQATPAAADVEHLAARLQEKLGSKMAFFGLLRLFERLITALEISAGILPVRVEEQVVQRTGQIVMMRHIGARPGQRIALSTRSLKQPAKPLDRVAFESCQALAGQKQKIPQRAAFNCQPAIHVGFAEGQ